jgi:hypothetical protein
MAVRERNTMEKLHNEGFHKFHFTPHTIRVATLRTVRWVCHLERFGKTRNVYRISVGQLAATSDFARPILSVDGRIACKWFVRKNHVRNNWIK